MAEYDLHNSTKMVHGIPAAVYTATTVVSDAIDTLGFESIEWVIHIGVAINGDYTVTLTESDTEGSTYTAVPAAETLGTLPVLTIADANKVFRVGSIGKKQFQKLTLTEGSANTAGVVGVTAILSNPKTVPTAAQAT